MTLDLAQCGLGALSGGLVGFALGLFGGGGSILAVPLMVYLVGVPTAHVAIGTSAVVVATNAATGLVEHARHGHVKWRSAALYSLAGTIAALLAAELGKAIHGQRLLLLFACLMVAVGILMLRTRDEDGDPEAECTQRNAPKVLGFGAATGALSGFFGIGGGFLIVPGLIAATGMPMINAVGTSLACVACFSLATATSYAVSGLVGWPLAIVFILGGFVGCHAGCALAQRLEPQAGVLKALFAGLIFVVAGYMVVKGWRAV